jgi:sigma-B regulation protein RsbU (phosphoserine phosphatase)
MKHRQPRKRRARPGYGAAAPRVAPATAYLVPAGPALEKELAELRRERKELHDALFGAAQVHRKLCAPRELRRGPFEIAGEMFAVRHLSGDFLKILDQGSTVGLAVGDIAGKGLSAGFWVSHLVGLVRLCLAAGGELHAAAAEINRSLRELAAEPPMTALFLARLDPQSGELAYCNAGQPSPLVVRRDGAVEWLEAGGPMLGALPGAGFESGRVTLEPGDSLVAYTDGVVESRGPTAQSREEEFGTRRLCAAVEETRGAPASQTLFSALGTALDFANGRPLEDDLTLMVVHRRPAPAPRAADAR